MQLLTALLALAACLASTSAATDHTKRFASLAARHGGVITLDTRTFDDITASPRNYSVSIALTALPAQFKCAPCREFDREMRLVAGSWKSSPNRNDHFFAVLDFPDGQDVFRRLGLQTAPQIRMYKPTEGPRAGATDEPEIFDFLRTGGSAEAFSTWVRHSAQIPLTFRRPIDYSKVASAFISLVAVVAFAWQFWPYVRRFLFGWEIWALLTNGFILLMTGGYMWNQIRMPPFVQPQPNGGVSYIAGGFQNQFGVETQIVASLYAVLAFSVYTLAVTIPWIKDPARQRIAAYIWSGVLLFMASVLVLVFRAKSPGGYPFTILFG